MDISGPNATPLDPPSLDPLVRDLVEWVTCMVRKRDPIAATAPIEADRRRLQTLGAFF